MNNPLSHYWINSSHNTSVLLFFMLMTHMQLLLVMMNFLCYFMCFAFFTDIWLEINCAVSPQQKLMCAAWGSAAAVLSVSEPYPHFYINTFEFSAKLMQVPFCFIVRVCIDENNTLKSEISGSQYDDCFIFIYFFIQWTAGVVQMNLLYTMAGPEPPR